MGPRLAVLFLLSIPLAACSSGIFAPVSTLTPTVTLTPTTTLTPTPTPTVTPTFTATPFPTAVGVALKFDDGVSLKQRETIQQGVALAQQYFGDAGALTIYAYASLDKLTEEYSQVNHVATNSRAATNFRQKFENDTIGLTQPGVIYVYMSDYWTRASLSSQLSTMAHEYFHSLQYHLSNMLEGEGGNWFIEGTAEWASYRAVANYGLVDFGYVRRREIDLTRGLISPLSAMETADGANQEDSRAKYTLGFLASEFLASIVGDDMLLSKYWSGLRFSPGWRAAFQSSFGLSVSEFYDKFEDYRRAQFPPYCGNVGDAVPTKDNGTSSLEFDRQHAPRSFAIVSDSSYIPYTFCLKGFRLTSLTSRQMNSAIKLPARSSTWNLCGGNCIVLSMSPIVPAGTYTLSVELPDGRKAEAKFEHSVPASAPMPTLTPRP